MHFIEWIFGIAPDGGNGFFEAVVFAAVVFSLGIPFRRKFARPLARFVRF